MDGGLDGLKLMFSSHKELGIKHIGEAYYLETKEES